MKATEIYDELCSSLATIRRAIRGLPDTETMVIETEKYRQILNGCASLITTNVRLTAMLIEKEKET